MKSNSNKDKKIMRRVFVITLAMLLAATIISSLQSINIQIIELKGFFFISHTLKFVCEIF